MVTADMVISVVTGIVTYFFGWLVKKFDLMESKYIPFQNLFIGVLSGCIIYALKINTNLLSAVVFCLFGSMGAGGVHDAIRTKIGDDNCGD